jgi:hypothetical protein
MAKENGLNVRLYVEGYDLSGDANSLGSLGYTNSLYDITTLDVSGTKRLLGPVDGSIDVNGYFDNASGRIHPVFTSNSGSLPTADQVVLVPLGSAVGDPSIGLVAKEGNYDTERGDSAITVTSTFHGNGYAPEFGEMLTAHDDTHSSAGSGTVVDSGASTSNGGSGYLQLLSLASGSCTVNLQESTSSGGSYSNFMTFSTVAAAAAPSAERVTMEGTVQRYIKVTTTGTFSNAKIVVGFSRS